MSVRPFDWRDLVLLYRYRNDCLFLNSTRLLTRGARLVPAASLVSPMSAAMGVFTYRCTARKGSRQSLIGQITHQAEKPTAQFSFVTPVASIGSDCLLEIIDYISTEMGKRGATRLLAEVNEQDDAFEALRKAGFATYSRQRIWRLDGEPELEAFPTPWQKGTSQDLISLRSLYCNLVPGMVQQVEQPPAVRPQGPVYREDGELLAYIETKTGPQGIWLQPFIHPNLEKVSGRLAYLLKNGFYRRSRPVYLCIRSYQSWLEPSIADLGAKPGPQQVLMVKHLAVRQYVTRAYVLPALERGHPEVTAPISGERQKI